MAVNYVLSTSSRDKELAERYKVVEGRDKTKLIDFA